MGFRLGADDSSGEGQGAGARRVGGLRLQQARHLNVREAGLRPRGGQEAGEEARRGLRRHPGHGPLHLTLDLPHTLF